MNRALKILLPWFDRREAIAALLGFRLPENDEESADASETFDAARATLQTRPPYADRAPLIEPLPAEIADHGGEFLEQFRAPVWGQDAPRDVRTAVVDLRQVIAFQKAISLEGIDDRVATASVDDWSSLSAICLVPPGEALEEELKGTFDKDSKGMTISSLNPNLRATQVRPTGRSRAGQVFSVEVVFGTPFVHVVEYRDRLFLRDGYHRTYGLLARGIHRVPCLYEKGTSATDVHKGGSAFIAHEHLFGPQPPMLTDFHHPDYSHLVEQKSFRKVIRIRVEEFVVQI
jgi:hypothetical protein